MNIKLPLLVLLLFIGAGASAQNWGGGVDDERVHFGFTFQYISSNYIVQKNPDWRAPFRDPDANLPITDTLSAVYGKSSPGFGIGFVVNGRISDHLDVRLTPTLVFSDRLMEYEYLQPSRVRMPFSSVEQKVSATVVEFPLGIKIKSNRRNNFRAYMLYGAKYSMDIASKKKTDDSGQDFLYKLLKNKKSYLSYEAAFGMDLYFEYFKMSPEIKLSYSLNNILNNDQPNPYNIPIDRLKLRHVTFSLFFE
ncbi:type IX secretion/gliding motility protein PorT/SprT [Pedobacter hartonius]|uniref:Probable protein-translocating porin PorT n=1 Tax=Pedobacter hartonius TaxID=425514 RepID=A0A1H4GUD0_9SPHI|nr:outer membrane beta-barrel protein [Pedobacter hartonius]SEB13154.1 probable protein-translocating porin PorT [Pedobacter hartonius]